MPWPFSAAQTTFSNRDFPTLESSEFETRNVNGASLRAAARYHPADAVCATNATPDIFSPSQLQL
jgi:hypothetical protein